MLTNIRNKKNLFIIAFVMVFITIGNYMVTYYLRTNPYDTIQVNASEDSGDEKKYIKWVDNNLTLQVLQKISKLDIDSHVNDEEVKYNWIELIAYLACKYGNNFKQFKQKDLDEVISKLKNGETMESITSSLKNYSYYFESYDAILHEFIGVYDIEIPNDSGEKTFSKKYGIKAFLPIAKGYSFSHYDDFGASRSYGYKRSHLGNDLMGSIGIPIIAVESGIVEAARMESIWWLENRNQKL